VGFTLTIPATLLTSTTRTLSNPSSGLLAAVPAMAAIQIGVAALLGQLAAAAVAGEMGAGCAPALLCVDDEVTHVCEKGQSLTC
jgi:hypothetical protein